MQLEQLSTLKALSAPASLQAPLRVSPRFPSKTASSASVSPRRPASQAQSKYLLLRMLRQPAMTSPNEKVNARWSPTKECTWSLPHSALVKDLKTLRCVIKTKPVALIKWWLRATNLCKIRLKLAKSMILLSLITTSPRTETILRQLLSELILMMSRIIIKTRSTRPTVSTTSSRRREKESLAGPRAAPMVSSLKDLSPAPTKSKKWRPPPSQRK